MAHINVDLPDDLAAEAEAAGIGISHVVKEAIRSAIEMVTVDGWLDSLSRKRIADVDRTVVLEAASAAKDDLEGCG